MIEEVADKQEFVELFHDAYLELMDISLHFHGRLREIPVTMQELGLSPSETKILFVNAIRDASEEYMETHDVDEVERQHITETTMMLKNLVLNMQFTDEEDGE